MFHDGPNASGPSSLPLPRDARDVPRLCRSVPVRPYHLRAGLQAIGGHVVELQKRDVIRSDGWIWREKKKRTSDG